MRPRLLGVFRWTLGNPFASLAVPPVLLLAQFLNLLLLFRVGLPQSMADAHGKVDLCILSLFATSLLSIPALMLAVRQVFLLPNKIAPSLGILANGFYFIGFLAFFVFCFVVRSFT